MTTHKAENNVDDDGAFIDDYAIPLGRVNRRGPREISKPLAADIEVHCATFFEKCPGPAARSLMIKTRGRSFYNSDYYRRITPFELELDTLFWAFVIVNEVQGSLAIFTAPTILAPLLNDGSLTHWQPEGWCMKNGVALQHVEMIEELFHRKEARLLGGTRIIELATPGMKSARKDAYCTWRNKGVRLHRAFRQKRQSHSRPQKTPGAAPIEAS